METLYAVDCERFIPTPSIWWSLLQLAHERWPVVRHQEFKL
jgi:hypothetical protein